MKKPKTAAFLRRMPALLCALVLLYSSVLAEGTVPSNEMVDKIFKQQKTIGGMVVVAKDGEIVYQRCYGFANPKKTIPVTPDHYYRLASVSKLVTATGGEVDIDRMAAALLKEFHDGKLGRISLELPPKR